MIEAAPETADGQTVLPDRKKKTCYVVGPVIMTGATVDKAEVAHDDAMDAWVILVHFGADEFLHKIADAEVGKTIAIVVDGVVQSAPMINPGITGRDIEISGDYDEAAARALAQRLDPSSD